MTEPTQPKLLRRGDTIPLPLEGSRINYAFGSLHIDKVEGSRISVSYHYKAQGEDKVVACNGHDLSQKPLLVGKSPDSALVLPDSAALDAESRYAYAMVSRDQAVIGMDAGGITYRHIGSNKIGNPHYLQAAPEMLGPIMAEAGNGGGYTHENRALNSRASNEDRGLAHRGLPLQDWQAVSYLERAIAGIAQNTQDHPGGSTLSAAMRTKDGNIACSFLGDSPIYAMAQNPQNGRIGLVQLGIPHNIMGFHMREEIARMDFAPPGNRFDTALSYVRDMNPELADKIDKGIPNNMRPLYKMLGSMGSDETGPERHAPDSFVVNPRADCPEGHAFLGLLVCSDGMEDAVGAQAVQKALTRLYREHKNPGPQAVSEAAVQAALPYTTDNVTAMMLPAKGRAGDMVAVADGNTGTAEVAQIAVDGLRERCQERFVPYVAKKDNQYRISLMGNMASTEEARQWLSGLAEYMKQSDPEHAFQMGMHVVRETLVIKNPTNKLRNYLDSLIRDQEKMPGRGRL